MSRWLTLFAGAVFLLAVPAEEAEAQVTFGPQVVLWDFDELGIGARVDVGLGGAFGIEEGFFETLFLSIDGNWLVDPPGDATWLIFNVNPSVAFPLEDAPVTPYAGLGLNFTRVSFDDFSDTSTGLNLLGGIFFDLGAIPAYVQLQHTTTGAGFTSILLGVMFGG